MNLSKDPQRIPALPNQNRLGSSLTAAIVHDDHLKRGGIDLLPNCSQASCERFPVVVNRNQYAKRRGLSWICGTGGHSVRLFLILHREPPVTNVIVVAWQET